jgi:hypothetical protein
MIAFESPQVENLRNGRQECLRYAGVLLRFVATKFSRPFGTRFPYRTSIRKLLQIKRLRIKLHFNFRLKC